MRRKTINYDIRNFFYREGCGGETFMSTLEDIDFFYYFDGKNYIPLEDFQFIDGKIRDNYFRLIYRGTKKEDERGKRFYFTRILRGHTSKDGEYVIDEVFSKEYYGCSDGDVGHSNHGYSNWYGGVITIPKDSEVLKTIKSGIKLVKKLGHDYDTQMDPKKHTFKKGEKVFVEVEYDCPADCPDCSCVKFKDSSGDVREMCLHNEMIHQKN